MKRGSAILLALVVAFGFFLRLRAANHPYISQWDEAYHALVARNMTAHPLTPTLYEEQALPANDREWTKAHIWLHKPPLPLWLMSAGIAAFGEGELSFRLPAVLLDTVVIVLVYLLALELFGHEREETGVLAAALYAVNPLMIRLVSGRIPDDTPHVVNAFLVALTAYLFLRASRTNDRGYAAAGGVTLALGTLCMSAIAGVGLVAALPTFVARRRLGLLPYAFVAFVMAAPLWPQYALTRWPDLWLSENAIQLNHLTAALDGHAHAWWWYLKIFPVQWGGYHVLAAGVAVSALVFCAYDAWRGRNAGLASALCWVVVPYLFFMLIATKLYAYVCVAVPALCLLTAYAAAGRRTLLFVVLLQLGLVAIERVRADYSIAPWNDVYDYPAFRVVMFKLRDVPGPKVLLNVQDNKSPQAMYYSKTAAYPEAPTIAMTRDLRKRGYKVFVLLEKDKAGSDIPQELRTKEFRKKIFFVPLPAPLANAPFHPYEA